MLLSCSRHQRPVLPLDGPTEFFRGKAETLTAVTHVYVRAVAKIAFHYTLKMSPDVDSAPELDGIRNYILNGGDAKPFVAFPAEHFVLPLGMGARPKYWGHFFFAERPASGPIVARVQLSVGPDYLPPPFAINIGDNRGSTEQRTGHYAYYFETDGHDDKIVDFPVVLHDGPMPYRRKWGFAKGEHKFKR